ncbi:c-type cytochrome [Novosphingobium sp. KACC 22771]|uniref:c-type cytochrome n=1 Tax=Novosphingobium sp. KACC 22771 TaxID=3025670 RepID=UPI002366C363|nr:cytochrome c [Novosphingobium sp. KACC 22771]WDF75165.1 cytochrome c [Novosphingobium sp. KACC 22771]
MTFRLLLAAALAVIPGPVMARSQAGDAPGGAEFKAYGCAACHGTTGAGGGWQGPRLAPAPLPYAAFLAQLREPASKMPRYSEKVLPEETVRLIYGYLQSIGPGKRAADIGMLNH